MSQVLDALAIANSVRLAAVKEKRAISALPMREGMLRCADILEHTPPAAESIRLGALLLSVQRFGPLKVDSFLASLQIRSTVADWRIRHLDISQREFLAEALREKAAEL